MKDGYNTRIDDNDTYRPDGWGIRDNKDDPITRRASEHDANQAQEASVESQPADPKVYETVASAVWPSRGETIQRSSVAAPPEQVITNPFFPDLTLSLHENDGGANGADDQLGPSFTERIAAFAKGVIALKNRARIPALVLGVLLLTALSAQFIASNFLHIHGFAQPTTIGTLTKHPSTIPLTLPNGPDIKKSFSTQFGDSATQIEVLAQLGTGQVAWSQQDLQAIQSETGITIDPTSTVQLDANGASMSCSTGVSTSGYVSVCFWTDYDVRSVVLDLTSSAPGNAAAWSTQVKQAIEG